MGVVYPDPKTREFWANYGRLGDDTMDEETGRKMSEAEILKAAKEEARVLTSDIDSRTYLTAYSDALRAAYNRIKAGDAK